jgi:hypothetical protein
VGHALVVVGILVVGVRGASLGRGVCTSFAPVIIAVIQTWCCRKFMFLCCVLAQVWMRPTSPWGVASWACPAQLPMYVTTVPLALTHKDNNVTTPSHGCFGFIGVLFSWGGAGSARQPDISSHPPPAPPSPRALYPVHPGFAAAFPCPVPGWSHRRPAPSGGADPVRVRCLGCSGVPCGSGGCHDA